jgi:hypothetical protein
VRFFLGVDITRVLAFAGTALTLGESELGEDWELGPSERFARYAFHVEVASRLTPLERRQVRALVEHLKPAHTHLIDLLEPGPTPAIDDWELGQSALDETTVLH